jgi:hypothetical protein
VPDQPTAAAAQPADPEIARRGLGRTSRPSRRYALVATTLAAVAGLVVTGCWVVVSRTSSGSMPTTGPKLRETATMHDIDRNVVHLIPPGRPRRGREPDRVRGRVRHTSGKLETALELGGFRPRAGRRGVVHAW